MQTNIGEGSLRIIPRAPSSENADDVLRLREHSALVERVQSLAAAEGHPVVSLSQAELHTCLLELTRYVERLD